MPDFEDETETEAFTEVHKGKKVKEDIKKSSEEGSSRTVPPQKQSTEVSSNTVPLQKQSSDGSTESTFRDIPSQSSEGTFREVPSQYAEPIHTVDVKEDKGSPHTIMSSKSTEDGSAKKRGVPFEVDGPSTHDADSSKLSSLTTLSAQETRDLQEVFAEIRDEFATASTYGKEVAMLLELSKLPYQPRFALLKGGPSYLG